MFQNNLWLNNKNNGGFVADLLNDGITGNLAELVAELHKLSLVVSKGAGKSLVYTTSPHHETGKNLMKKRGTKYVSK